MLPLILGGAALLLYQQSQKKAAQGGSGSPPTPTSNPSAYYPAQPSQRYPFRPTVPPRVDNKNQPWYNGARDFMTTPGAVAGLAGNVSTVVHSVGDVWGQMSDWFGGNDAKSNLASTDSLPSVEDTSGLTTGEDQSDAVGSQVVADASSTDTYSDTDWDMGSSNDSEVA